MKLQITEEQKLYEIEFAPLTQLCGMNLIKKKYIITSILKHFSSGRYLEYEKKLLQNVRLEGKTVGRKYFKTYYLREREDFISGIRLGKTSLMMQYLSDQIQKYECQKLLEEIDEQLQRIFMALNEDLFSSVGNLEFRYEEKDLFSIIQNTEICGKDEKPIEAIDMWELVQMYLGILLEVHQKNPEKTLIVLENIDHLLGEEEYAKLCRWIERIGNKYDVWFLLTTSLPGYVYVTRESIIGINIVNDLVYSMPSYENVCDFLENNYPCTYLGEEWEMEFQSIVHYIGKERMELYPRGMVLLKLINGSICVDNVVKKGLNQLENAFLIS